MILKEVVGRINQCESRLAVDTITYKNIKLWPLIRTEVAISLLSKNKYTSPYQAKKTLFIKYKNAIDTFFLSIIYHYKTQRGQRKNPDILWITKAHEYTEISGRQFHKFADALDIVSNHQYKTLHLLLFKPKNHHVFYNRNILVANQPLIAIKTFLHRITIRKINFNNLNLLTDINNLASTKISPELIKNRAVYIDSVSSIFEKKLKKISPKCVFIRCYYQPNFFALAIACKNLKIPLIEFQHGAQNNYHFMYTNWLHIPSSGYSMIPDFFWMWGTPPAKRIATWANKTKAHQVIVGGNPWLAIHVYNQNKLDFQLNLIEELTRYKKNILISLQLWPDSFPDFLREVIRESPFDWCWLIRTHPNHWVSESKINNLLDNNFKCRINYNLANQTPLYRLLNNIDIHITGYSTVAFEASAFKVPTIFIHKNAKEGFKEQIDNNEFGFAQSASELKNLLEHKFNPSPYIDTDLQQINQTLDNLLSTRMSI